MLTVKTRFKEHFQLRGTEIVIIGYGRICIYMASKTYIYFIMCQILHLKHLNKLKILEIYIEIEEIFD